MIRNKENNQRKIELYKELEAQECRFCPISKRNKFIEITKKWAIIENYAPWEICKEHLVVVLNRHLPNKDFTKLHNKEKRELRQIRQRYSIYSLVHNGEEAQSMDHFHVHLIRFK